MQNTNIPPAEIFLEICSFLPPADLFTLSQVCRKFREYLFAPNSSNTQEVWKNSRLQFMPKEVMPPPEGMSEEKYVGLLMIERGCQFCKVKKCKIYWQFEVRCCWDCLKNETILQPNCNYQLHCPAKFIRVMPHFDQHYWIDQIDLAYSQYCDLSKNEKENWLYDKKLEVASIMKYIEQRERMN